MPTTRCVVRISHPALGGDGTNTWHILLSGEEGSWLQEQGEGMAIVKEFYEGCSGVFPDTASFTWDGSGALVGAEEGQTLQSTALYEWTTVGDGAGGVIPPANCIVVSWKTGVSGRHGMGRTFLGPIHNSALEANGTPTGAALAIVRDAAAELVGTANTDGPDGAPGVYSPAQNAWRHLVGSSVRDRFGVLRSRRD